MSYYECFPAADDAGNLKQYMCKALFSISISPVLEIFQIFKEILSTTLS